MAGIAKVFGSIIGTGFARALIGGVAFLWAVAGNAAIIVTGNSSQTVYGYGYLGTPFLAIEKVYSVVNGGSVAGFPAEYGLDFATSSSNNSFSFLQNQYCVGKCTTYAMTTVTLTLTNTGLDPEAMRFDSQITAGHLARIGHNPAASATFDFAVVQDTSGSTRTLYSAAGLADATKTEITTSDGLAFNGLVRSSGPDYDVLDWSATMIALMLDPVAPGASSTLTYTSLTRTTTSASECVDITDCAGVQVVFGDPRNDGSASRSSGGARAPAPVPVIGGQYEAADVPIDIVALGAPLPPQPPQRTPPDYTTLFVSQVTGSAVPEPASWALAIAGFGLLGIMLRRRRDQGAFSALES